MREIGGMTVREMLRRMSSSEITDWAAIFEIEDEKAAKNPKAPKK